MGPAHRDCQRTECPSGVTSSAWSSRLDQDEEEFDDEDDEDEEGGEGGGMPASTWFREVSELNDWDLDHDKWDNDGREGRDAANRKDGKDGQDEMSGESGVASW